MRLDEFKHQGRELKTDKVPLRMTEAQKEDLAYSRGFASWAEMCKAYGCEIDGHWKYKDGPSGAVTADSYGRKLVTTLEDTA